MNEKWYFTFMGKQGTLKYKYICLSGTYNSAREKMNEMFGERWAFQYSESEFKPQIEMFGLEELYVHNSKKESLKDE